MIGYERSNAPVGYSLLATALALLGLFLTACEADSTATPIASEASPEATATPSPMPSATPVQEDASVQDSPYSGVPAMQIDTDKHYVATIKTEKGDIIVELFDDEAPQTVNNFVFLARDGYYDGTTFHRVLPGFMAQGGDPTGTGTGGPGYRFGDEFHPSLSHDRVGTLSMANSGPNTNGSQFFITYVPTTWLDDRHTVFGRVIGGLDVLFSLSERDPERATAPGDLIETIVIEEHTAPVASEIPPNEDIPVPAEPQARYGMYPRPPEMRIDPTKSYTATISTPKGEIVLRLAAEVAPITVNNFVFLARQGFYDGLTFHRVEPGFVVQGGDPVGTGEGGPGYVLPAEIELLHEVGSVAMARLPDRGNPRRMSSGSQFYIALDALPQLDGSYTVFGTVVEGMDVVESIAVGDVMEQVTIEEE
ncbi:MAG: peptidylprolyl isomerase [Anaerolineae bacterium]